MNNSFNRYYLNSVYICKPYCHFFLNCYVKPTLLYTMFERDTIASRVSVETQYYNNKYKLLPLIVINISLFAILK